MDRFQHLPLICVWHVQNAAHFGMPLGFLEHLRKSNLPTIISTFYVSELWLLTLFPPALLFHLMCCHRWARFTKNSCVLFLESLLDMLYVICCCYMLLLFVFVSCFATTNWPQFVVQFIVARRRLQSKTQSKNQSIVQSIVQSRVQSPGFTPTPSGDAWSSLVS